MGRLREQVWTQKRVRVEVLVGNAAGIGFWRAVGFEDYCLTLEMEPTQGLGGASVEVNGNG